MKEAIKQILKDNAWEMEKDRYVIGLSNIDNIADEVVKLFLIPTAISSFVCGHPPKQTYLNDGVWHCEKCGGKWNSIANK